MRFRVVTFIFIGAAVLLGGLFLISGPKKGTPAKPALSEPAVSTPLGAAEPALTKQAPSATASDIRSPQDENQDSPAERHQAMVEARTAELMDIAMTDDPTNLDIILGELSNRDPEIRKAAREAAVQFGSREAIPKLVDAANFTDDLKEKAELIEAAEFLKLPSLTEVTAQSGQANGAQKILSGKRHPRRMLSVPPAPAAQPPQ